VLRVRMLGVDADDLHLPAGKRTLEPGHRRDQPFALCDGNDGTI
jgi:hypothetical protein